MFLYIRDSGLVFGEQKMWIIKSILPKAPKCLRERKRRIHATQTDEMLQSDLIEPPIVPRIVSDHLMEHMVEAIVKSISNIFTRQIYVLFKSNGRK